MRLFWSAASAVSTLHEVARRLDDDGWTTWNLSRSAARDVLDTHGPVPASGC